MLAYRLRRWPNTGWTPCVCFGERHNTQYMRGLDKALDCHLSPTTVLPGPTLFQSSDLSTVRTKHWTSVGLMLAKRWPTAFLRCGCQCVWLNEAGEWYAGWYDWWRWQVFFTHQKTRGMLGLMLGKPCKQWTNIKMCFPSCRPTCIIAPIGGQPVI